MFVQQHSYKSTKDQKYWWWCLQSYMRVISLSSFHAQLLLLAVRKVGEGLVMWYLLPLTSQFLLTLFNLLSLQRPDKLQMRGRSYLYNISWFETKPLRDGCNATVIPWKRFLLFTLCSEPSLWKVLHLQLITTLKVRLLAWISFSSGRWPVFVTSYAICILVLYDALWRLRHVSCDEIYQASPPPPRFLYCMQQKLGVEAREWS